MKRTVLVYGLIAGAVLSLMLLVTLPFQEAIGFDTGAVIGYTTMVAAFLLIFFGVKSYRDSVGGGAVSFGRALLVGVLIASIASACYVVTWEFIYFKLHPEFLQKYQDHAIAQARAGGQTEAQIEQMRQQMDAFGQMYQNPLFNSAITFIEPMPVGLVIALVSAGVLRRRPTALPASA